MIPTAKMLRGQVSIELLVTIAFAVTILMSVLAFAYLQSVSSTDQLSYDQAQQSVNRLKSLVDSVGAQGPPAKATITLTMPLHVSSIVIGSATPPNIGKEIVFTVNSRGTNSEIVKSTTYLVTGDLSNSIKPGDYPISAEAVDDCMGTGVQCVVLSQG